jgi:hypothetical protein
MLAAVMPVGNYGVFDERNFSRQQWDRFGVIEDILSSTRNTPMAKIRQVFEDKRIKGLFAAGNTMGWRFLVDYPIVAAGVSHGMALTQGRQLER